MTSASSGASSALILGACGHQWYVQATQPLNAEQRTIEKAKGCPTCVDLQRRIDRTLLFIAEVAMQYPAQSVIYGAWMAAARSLKTPASGDSEQSS